MNLAAEHKANGAEFLDLLCAIVKVEDLDLPLKRNQGYVMKAVMTHYNDVAYIMNEPKEKRFENITVFFSQSLRYLTI